MLQKTIVEALCEQVELLDCRKNTQYTQLVAFDGGERIPNRVLGVLYRTLSRKSRYFLCIGIDRQK